MAANGDGAPETPLGATGSAYDSYVEPASPYTRAAAPIPQLQQPQQPQQPYAAAAPRPPAVAAVTKIAAAPSPAAAALAPYTAVHADDDPDGYGGTVPAAALVMAVKSLTRLSILSCHCTSRRFSRHAGHGGR